MFQRIVLPLDGSRRAEAAIPVAARLARAAHGTVILMRAVEPLTAYGPYLSKPSGPASTYSSQARDDVSSYLNRVAGDTSLADLHVTIRVTEGSAADSILSVSQTERADLIVMCAHGVSGPHHWKLGGVSQHVVRHALSPVLLLSEPTPGAEPDASEDQLAHVLHALIPLDGSIVAEAAIPPAIELMSSLAPHTGTLHLLEVVSPFTAEELKVSEAELVERTSVYLDRVARQLRATPTEHLRLAITSSVVVDADAAERIISVAEPEHEVGADAHASGYDVIVMATHGRTGIARWALGSITERIIQTSRLPLLIVRPFTALSTAEAEATSATAPLASRGV